MGIKYYEKRDLEEEVSFLKKLRKKYDFEEIPNYCLGGLNLGVLQSTLLLFEEKLVFIDTRSVRSEPQTYLLIDIMQVTIKNPIFCSLILHLSNSKTIEISLQCNKKDATLITDNINKQKQYLQDNMDEGELESRILHSKQLAMQEESLNLQKDHLDQERKSEANKVHCPKCGSSSISLDRKRLSLRRAATGAIIGAATFGVGTAAGAVGAVTSKKKMCVCMNCGHKWKL